VYHNNTLSPEIHSLGAIIRHSVKSRLEVGEFTQSQSTPYNPSPSDYSGELKYVHGRHYAIGKLLYKPRASQGLWIYSAQDLANSECSNDTYVIIDNQHRIYAVPVSETTS
jgi:hypothetical protein